MFYDIYYKCPKCSGDRFVQSHIQLDTAEYDGLPLTDFYTDANMETVIRGLPACSCGSEVEPSGFYVKICRPAN